MGKRKTEIWVERDEERGSWEKEEGWMRTEKREVLDWFAGNNDVREEGNMICLLLLCIFFKQILVFLI